MDTIEHIRRRFEALSPHLDEKSLRLLVASETLPLGHGGVTLVSTATGVARSTICRGLAELGEEPAPSGRVRRPGGGRKPAVEVRDGLEEALDALVEPAVRGDPERPLRWISKSLRHISDALSDQGFSVSHTLAGRLLKQQGDTLQGNVKTREGTDHPDRDAQFHHINDQVAACAEAGQPVISVDTRKRELVGDFRNSGREWRPKGSPEEVRVHDFADKEPGKAVANVFFRPHEMPRSQWARCMALDLKACWATAEAVLPAMRTAGRGSIVNIASSHSFKIIPHTFPYPVAKHGLVGLTRALGIEYAAEGIRVNAIAPGYIDTQIARDYWAGFDNPVAERAKAERLHPPQGIGTPEEVAMTAVFVASDEAPFINAETIVNDGGRSALYYGHG